MGKRKSVRAEGTPGQDDDVEISKTHGLTGLKKWIREYNDSIIPLSQLKEDVQNFMEKFEKDEIRIKKEEMNGGIPDEDGWTTIARKGKKAGIKRTEKMEEELKAKKQKYETKIVNFTPRQMKESKAQQLEDLKKKFEQDKERVNLIKQQNKRKFRPF